MEVIQIHVTELLMQKVSIDEVYAYRKIRVQLALHAETEVLCLAGREVVRKEFRASLENIDGTNREIRIIGIHVQRLDGHRTDGLQDEDQVLSGERRGCAEV